MNKANGSRPSQRKSAYRQLMMKKAAAAAGELNPDKAVAGERKADAGSFRRASISVLQEDNKRPRKPSRSDKNSVKSPLSTSNNSNPRSPLASLTVSNDSDDCFYSRTRADSPFYSSHFDIFH